LVEHGTFNAGVAGSSPAGLIQIRYFFGASLTMAMRAIMTEGSKRFLARK
jgi:hypothetical protein